MSPETNGFLMPFREWIVLPARGGLYYCMNRRERTLSPCHPLLNPLSLSRAHQKLFVRDVACSNAGGANTVAFSIVPRPPGSSRGSDRAVLQQFFRVAPRLMD